MAKEKTIIHNLSEGPVFGQLVRFSIPIIIGNMLQASYTIADMVIVGNYVGTDGLSAVGIGGILQNLLLMVGSGLGYGGQIILSQQVGAKAHDAIQKTIGTFMTITALCAILFGIFGAFLTHPLLAVLHTPDAALEQTRTYYLICCCGMLFIYGYNCICAVLRGLGESKLPTIFIALATAVNIGLDLLFIVVFHMGVGSAAMATVIAQGIACVTSLFYLYYRRKAIGFDFRFKSFRVDRKAASIIIRLSLPMIFFGMLLTVSMMFVNSNVNIYGIAASAVDGVGNKVNMVANAIIMGLYLGGGAIIGQCFGAGNYARIRRVFWMTICFSLIIWGITAFCVICFAEPIFWAFTQNEEALAMAPKYMLIAALSYLGMALGTGGFALFEGVGNTNLEMVAGIIESLVVKIVLGIVFSRRFGLYGYWLGYSVSTFTSAIIGYIYYFSGLWTKRKVPCLTVNTD